VAGVPDEHNRVALRGELRCLAVDLGDERAGGVDRLQAPLGCPATHLRGHAMGGIEQLGALGHLLQIVDEHHANLAKALHHPGVVYDLVKHVDRSAEPLEGRLQALDCHVHPRAEAAGAGQDDPHGSLARASLS